MRKTKWKPWTTYQALLNRLSLLEFRLYVVFTHYREVLTFLHEFLWISNSLYTRAALCTPIWAALCLKDFAILTVQKWSVLEFCLDNAAIRIETKLDNVINFKQTWWLSMMSSQNFSYLEKWKHRRTSFLCIWIMLRNLILVGFFLLVCRSCLTKPS